MLFGVIPLPGPVPAPYDVGLAVGYIPARQVRGCLGIQYRAVRLWLYLRYGLFDLQSADFLCFL